MAQDKYTVETSLDILAKSLAQNSRDVLQQSIKDHLRKVNEQLIDTIAQDLADGLEARLDHMVSMLPYADGPVINVKLSVNKREVPRRPKDLTKGDCPGP